MSLGFAKSVFARTPFAGWLFAPTTAATSTYPYRLELRDADGALLRILTEWTSGEWSQSANRPDILTLSYPGDSGITYAADLAYDNEIWLYSGGILAQRFVIVQVDERAETGTWLEIEATDMQYKLSLTAVTDYEDEATLLEHVVALLALQAGDNPVVLGSVAAQLAGITTTERFTSTNVLAALQSLVADNGGILSVDTGLRLNWRASTAANQGHIIRLAKNSPSITRRRDWRSGTVENTYDIGLIDLGAIGNEFDAAMLEIGRPVRVIVNAPAIDAQMRITDIKRDLAKPLDATAGVTVAVADSSKVYVDNGVLRFGSGRMKNLADFLTELARLAQIEHMSAADLYDILSDPNNPWYDPVTTQIETIAAEVAGETVTPGSNIQSVGTANAAGSGGSYARDDHVHNITAQAATATPQSVGASGAVGTGAKYARDDHVHMQRLPFIAANATARNALTGVQNGDLCYQTDSGTFYLRRADAWIQLAVITVGGTAHASPSSGDFWLNVDNLAIYNTDSEWQSLTHYEVPE